MIVFDQSDIIAATVASLIPGCERGFSNYTAIGFLDQNGTFQAGIVYHNWSPECGVIEMTGAAVDRKWLTRERMRLMFAYPFEQLGCRMAVARIGEKNLRARRICKAFGAVEYVIPELLSPDEGQCTLILKREDWANNPLSWGPHGLVRQTIRTDPA